MDFLTQDHKMPFVMVEKVRSDELVKEAIRLLSEKVMYDGIVDVHLNVFLVQFFTTTNYVLWNKSMKGCQPT